MKEYFDIDKEFKFDLDEKDTEFDTDNSHDIAIIGISVKMPKADSLDELWNIIKNGIECTTEFPEQRKKDIENYLNYINNDQKSYKFCKESYLDEIDKFDCAFFNIPPKEAELMNPLQRMYLENIFNAIEDAGYSSEELNGSKTGVYLGFISDLEGYKYREIIHNVNKSLLPMSTAGNLSSMIASRIAYFLNLKGPSMLIDTACSSSLVAVHLASQALRKEDCNMAIVGAAKINLIPLDDDCYKIGIESPDGMTRTFDNNANGSGYGEGIISVVLKRLDKAKNDNDNIYAVIKGSAINQDGTSAGITAPNEFSQANVITQAWKDSGVEPNEISYIEAHGTATNIGDSIEIEGLKNAFKRYTDKKQFCAIGSIKSNIGHLFDCAGLAGLIKSVLALKHTMIPPTINFNEPKENVNFEEMPFYINNKLRFWKSDFKRICGVSSFGISGTNCHVVLQEYDMEENKRNFKEVHGINDYLLTISAKNKNSLDEMIKKYKEFLNNTELNIGDICFTANKGRNHYNYRLAIIGRSKKDLLNKLNELVIDNNESKDIKYGEYKIIKDDREIRSENQITEFDVKELTTKLKKKIDDYVQQDRKNKECLREICDLYVQGGNIQWNSFYKGLRYNRASIPCYQFNNKRFWMDIPSEKRLDTEDNLYYEMGWQTDKLENVNIDKCTDSILVFEDNADIWSNLKGYFFESPCKIITVKYGNGFKKINSDSYILGNSESDYNNFINELKSENIRKIIHLTTAGKSDIIDIQKLKENQDIGVYSLFNIVKAINLSSIKTPIDVLVVSKYISEVTGEEDRICPENAPIMGIGKVINKEFPNIRCRCIDIDDDINYIDLFYEIVGGAKDYHVAYRKNIRYVKIFKESNIEVKEDYNLEIKKKGVYIITGGLGAIGVNVVKYMINQNEDVNIVLLGRSELPDTSSSTSANEQEKKKINRFKEIHKLSSNVIYKAVDICDEKAMKSLLSEIRNVYGKINGIIHAAGLAGSGFIINKNKQEFDKVLNPKIYGTWIIDNLTKDDDLDFMVLFSSGVSFVGEAGLSDYTAANSYLDSYSFYRNKQNRRTITINWVVWNNNRMKDGFAINIDGIFKAIDSDLAIKGLDKVLNKEVKEILIGELNLESKFMYLLKDVDLRLSEKLQKIVDKSKNRMASQKNERITKSNNNDAILKGKREGEYSDIEKTLANIYKKVLGFDEVDIYDNFFELGGDSILLSKMHLEIEMNFPGKVNISDLFAYTSIYKLAQYIEGSSDRKERIMEKKEINELDEEALNDMFNKMEDGEMSIEEVISSVNKDY